MEENKVYACIDFKSFYASVECAERDLDPFTTSLVVADETRGNGAVTLAITPYLKSKGIKNRCRIFEIPRDISYIKAMPRMKLYMEYSADIYAIYLRYISPEDIYIYSIDECFIDLTPYLKLYNMKAKDIVIMIKDAILKEKKIPSSAGIGTNLFLAKVALDVVAKKTKDGIGMLDLKRFKKYMWNHRPITDIWNIGKGIAKRLEKYGVYDLYSLSLMDEATLYKEFGENALFLIEHSKGIEPCTIAEIKAYKSKTKSISNSQILFEDYPYEDAKIILLEMLDNLVLELIAFDYTTDNIGLGIRYSGNDRTSVGGSKKISFRTNSFRKLSKEYMDFFEEKVDKNLKIKQISLSLNNIYQGAWLQMDLFSNHELEEKDEKVQKAVLKIKEKFGKNAILRGTSMNEKATGKIRNKLIGGHNG
ncbi:DNA repair protein [Streptobacillus felis]|uniref:DNA repair protein n=1 Tax=Streptobacillus felis TaxID=1384509 RepID=A0A7Z0PGQ5_9FUSO|nr:DNA repair protein [Streptobacillus felis]NYV28441.1 DNA repair protein [Streptobacillus felis]